MPLVSFSGGQAIANVRSTRLSLWPDGRRDRVRLDGVAQVAIEPSFQLVEGEAVFTMGSCFARNIESRLAKLGFDVPTMDIKLPAEERASDIENDLLNKYPPHSILNELRWALDPDAAFPENALLEVKENRWHDPHLAGNLVAAPRERVLERRAMVRNIYRQLPRCRVVVMTLGLVEAWYDTETGLYLNGAPPTPVVQQSPDRFRLDVLTVPEIIEVLEEIYAVLKRFGHPDFRMLLTVSPVPFKATFTGRDAITANSYSKSALRAAAEVFTYGREGVDYFPSYEIVTHTSRSSAFIQDNRHVSADVVNAIVDRVAGAYCPALLERSEEEGVRRGGGKRAITRALAAGDFAEAARHYAQLGVKAERYERHGYSEFRYRYEYGKALARSGQLAEAQAQFAKTVILNPASAPAHHHLGLVLAKLQRPLEAEDVFRRAVELDPAAIEIRVRFGHQLAANGARDEAGRQFELALRQNPDHVGAKAALEALAPRQASESEILTAGSDTLP